MNRVLFVAYLFPPIANSGTRRSLCFVNHLPDHGWSPLVLTVNEPVNPNDCDPTLLTEVRPGTQVERAPLVAKFLARWLAQKLTSADRSKQLEDALAWRLARVSQVFAEASDWYPLAVKRGVALHKQQGFDVIYASGWPWTSFLIARAISKQTGCPYVLDYRDTWKPSGTHAWEGQSKLQAWLNPWLERFAARRASAVVTVTPSLVSVIQRDSGAAQVHCITNGFEPEDFEDAPSARAARRDGMVRVSYTGVWRPGYGLDDLYKAIQLLKAAGSPVVGRLRVVAAGFAPGPAKEFGVDDVVAEPGPVPHAQAVRYMAEADALYLPVPSGFYASASLPGKLFEYIGSGQPIVAVVPQGSEVARVLGDVGGGCLIAPGDVARLAQLLTDLCGSDPLAAFEQRKPERLQAYTRQATTGQLAQVFNAVLNASCGGNKP